MAAHGLTARCSYVTQEDVEKPRRAQDSVEMDVGVHTRSMHSVWGASREKGFAFAPPAGKRGTAQVLHAPGQHGSRRRHFSCFILKKVQSGKAPWCQVSDFSVPAAAFCPNPRQHAVPALGSVFWSARAAVTTDVHASLARLDKASRADGDLSRGSVGTMRAFPAAAVFLPLPLHAAFDFLLGSWSSREIILTARSTE